MSTCGAISHLNKICGATAVYVVTTTCPDQHIEVTNMCLNHARNALNIELECCPCLVIGQVRKTVTTEIKTL